jgi:hypothetical protein
LSLVCPFDWKAMESFAEFGAWPTLSMMTHVSSFSAVWSVACTVATLPPTVTEPKPTGSGLGPWVLGQWQDVCRHQGLGPRSAGRTRVPSNCGVWVRERHRADSVGEICQAAAVVLDFFEGVHADLCEWL